MATSVRDEVAWSRSAGSFLEISQGN